MFKKLSLFVILLSLIVLTSCSTDFSLNAPYKRTPVIFGLLDQSDSIHFVKITRTFLGEGNNNEFAQIADSSYFDQVDAKVYEINTNGDTLRQWQLHDTLIPNKESGTFYAPEQKVYVFYAKDLDQTMTYGFGAILDEGKYAVNAQTQLIENFSFSFIVTSPGFSFSFGSATSSATGNYGSFISSYTEGKHGALYNTKIDIRYRETYADGSTSNKVIVWSKGDVVQEKPESPSSATINFGGEEFYTTIKGNLTVDNNVIKRQILGLDLVTAIAHTEFAKYMEISQPSSGITQATPQYTNINSETEEGALGLFSSRHIVSVKNIQLSSGAMEELCTGQHTAIFGFCSTYPEHSSKSFFCN